MGKKCSGSLGMTLVKILATELLRAWLRQGSARDGLGTRERVRKRRAIAPQSKILPPQNTLS